MGSDVMSFFLVDPLPLTFLILYFSQIGWQQDLGSNIYDLCVENNNRVRGIAKAEGRV